MATPANELDKFVTYIPHYELHVAPDWETLKKVETADFNAETTSTEATNTLLINTRKDVHQQIDNIKFHYLSSSIEPSGAMHPIGMVSLEIVEPNGTSFIEKLQNVQTKYKVSNISGGLIFGLKIFFVGRLASGAEKTLPFSKIIPLQIATLDADFSHKGGKYNLTFDSSGSAGVSTSINPENGLSNAIAFTNKNVSLKSKTVVDAITQLEQKLNQNYEDLYTTERKNKNGSKPLKYKINLDPDITGNLYLSIKGDSYNQNELCEFTFTNNIDIASMIRSILYASKEVNELIGGSKDGIFKEFHPNVRLPVVSVSYVLNADGVLVVYNIQLYKGGRTETNTFEMDYYFSGKNVDILDFSIRFPSMINWMSSSKAGTNLHSNNDSNIPSTEPQHFADNVCHKDVTKETIISIPNEQKDIKALSGDPALTCAVNRLESTGHAKYQAAAVPAARLAFETIALACSAIGEQLTFTIRGYYQILERVVLYPEVNIPINSPIGVDNGAWVKVNIFNADGSPFFYTGHYRITGVENIFSGGKFLQHLTVQMMDR